VYSLVIVKTKKEGTFIFDITITHQIEWSFNS